MEIIRKLVSLAKKTEDKEDLSTIMAAIDLLQENRAELQAHEGQKLILKAILPDLRKTVDTVTSLANTITDQTA